MSDGKVLVDGYETLLACRIMKARKTMKNQQLTSEVVSQISQRFTPKVSDIKKVSGQVVKKGSC